MSDLFGLKIIIIWDHNEVAYMGFSLSRKISGVDHLRVDFEDFHSLFIIIITIYGL